MRTVAFTDHCTGCIEPVWRASRFSAYHLSKFVGASRKKFRKEVEEEFKDAGINATKEQIYKVAEERVEKDIDKGVQTIQYQVVTLMTTNGQAPFITLFMYLDEAPEGQERDDLAMVDLCL